MKSFYRIRNAADDPTVAEIFVDDFIGDWVDNMFGFGVTAKAFLQQLADLPSDVRTIQVHINSPGGDVQAGVNIANALRAQQSKGRRVETIVDGIAASIASVIAMAGETVTMADNALLMIHEPYMGLIGTSTELRKGADVLDTIRGQIITTYQWHSPLTAEQLGALMTAETWMDADEAIANGFATDKIEGLSAAAMMPAQFNQRAMAALKYNIPARHGHRAAALIAPPTTITSDDVLRQCQQANLPIAFAAELIEQRATKVEVAQRIERARNVRSICGLAGVTPTITDILMRNQALSLTDIKALLVDFRATADGSVEIDSYLHPDGAARRGKRAATNPNAMFAEAKS